MFLCHNTWNQLCIHTIQITSSLSILLISWIKYYAYATYLWHHDLWFLEFGCRMRKTVDWGMPPACCSSSRTLFKKEYITNIVAFLDEWDADSVLAILDSKLWQWSPRTIIRHSWSDWFQHESAELVPSPTSPSTILNLYG